MKQISILGINFLPEVIDQVVRCYCEGMSVFEITSIVGLGYNEVNEILDTFTQYL